MGQQQRRQVLQAWQPMMTVDPWSYLLCHAGTTRLANGIHLKHQHLKVAPQAQPYLDGGLLHWPSDTSDQAIRKVCYSSSIHRSQADCHAVLGNYVTLFNRLAHKLAMAATHAIEKDKTSLPRVLLTLVRCTLLFCQTVHRLDNQLCHLAR